MTAIADSFFKSLLAKTPQSALQGLDTWASPEITARVAAVAGIEAKPLHAYFLYPKEILSHLHQSWFEDVVACCPKYLRQIGLQAIQEEMGVAKKRFSEPVRRFLLQKVLSQWPEKDISGESVAQLDFLKTCTGEELETLADLISVYDIVEDVRKIVEKKKLQLLFARLSPMQQKYLKQLLQGKKYPHSSAIDLKAFLQEERQQATEKLRLHGLKKIGRVLEGESQALVWLVLHRMDKKLAQLIQKGKETPEVPYDLPLLQKQFIHAFQFVQRG